MTGRRLAILTLLAAILAVIATPASPPRPVAAAEYTLETSAAYDVRPEASEIGVTVQITFTNTTPDPAGQFSVFDEVKLAVHDEAAEVTASDDAGTLDVTVGVEDEVNVATIALRDEVRFEDSVDLELQYTLRDGDDRRLRVRPSVVVFPAWSFGTESQVSVAIPDGYDVRIDGDQLTEADGRLVSGPIDNPAAWLALVTATRPAEYVTFDATVPLGGGTADLQVRAFADDEAWGERTLALIERALPMLEEEIGLPYPRVGELVLTESVASNASGFAETPSVGTEILVAFDQPEFTALHQVAHVWLSPALIEARWIREGLASAIAERAANQLDVQPPYDPVEEVAERTDAAFPLDGWAAASADPASEGYGHAASWSFISELSSDVGPDALGTVLVRVASSIGPYAETEVDAEPPAGAGPPQIPLTSRSFLDHLEGVSGMDLAERFSQSILSEADGALLPARAEARAAFDDLVADADGWGAPDPIRVAMADWQFDEARSQIAEAIDWLGARDDLLVEMEAAGLSAPDRLQQAYRSFGGGAEAQAELGAQRAVVEAYAATAADLNSARTFLERVGLIGGPDPAEQLRLANGRFADSDLRGAVEAISEAQRILESAEGGGMVRLISAVLVALILAALAVVLFRRRAAYTAAR